MRTDPTGQVLVQMGFDIGVTASAQYGDKDLSRLHFTRVWATRWGTV